MLTRFASTAPRECTDREATFHFVYYLTRLEGSAQYCGSLRLGTWAVYRQRHDSDGARTWDAELYTAGETAEQAIQEYMGDTAFANAVADNPDWAGFGAIQDRYKRRARRAEALAILRAELARDMVREIITKADSEFERACKRRRVWNPEGLTAERQAVADQLRAELRAKWQPEVSRAVEREKAIRRKVAELEAR